MKTAILQLDAFDNVISIKDKIAWSKTQRILLVWPNKGKIKLNEMDIILILRSSESLGAQIAVVTDEAVIINQLKELGISIFSSIPEAQKKPWRKPKIRNRLVYLEKAERNWNIKKLEHNPQTQNPPISKLAQWNIFLSGILSTLLIVLIFLPSANIFLSPELEVQSIKMNFYSDPTINEIDAAGTIPFTLIEIEIEGQLEGDSSGIIRVPDKKAVGTVTFRNLSDQEILVPIGTIVRTNTDPFIRYETTKKATLPAGIESQIDLPIISTTGGIVGNVPGGSISSIEDDLGGNLVVFNLNAITGGVDIKTLSPTEKDYENLKKELLEELINEAYKKMKANNPQAFLISEATIKVDKIISEERIPAVGDPAERHLLKIKANLSGWMIETEEIKKAVYRALDSDLTAQFSSGEGDLEIGLINDSVKFDQNKLSWDINSSRIITPSLDVNQLKVNILGKEIKIAKSLIEDELNLSVEPVIEIFPSFWKYLPYFPFRINMVIDGN